MFPNLFTRKLKKRQSWNFNKTTTKTDTQTHKHTQSDTKEGKKPC